MSNISVSLPSDGTTADVADYNTPINTIVNEINGNLDNSNIKSGAAIATAKLADDAGITTAKLADDSVTAAKVDWASTGANAGIWWEELGRTTLGANGDSISVTVPARRYLKILGFTNATGGNVTHGFRFNSDTGNNYAVRYNDNTTTVVSQNEILMQGAVAQPTYFELYIVNLVSSEKFVALNRFGGTTGAATAPANYEQGTGKWANTSAQITTIELRNTSAGDFTSGSELVVLGHN